MSPAPIHFVDIAGALQELGPGARIQFNTMSGVRDEIVLVGRADLDQILSDVHDLDLIKQQFLDHEENLNNRILSLQAAGCVHETSLLATNQRIEAIGQALSDDLMSTSEAISTVERELYDVIASLFLEAKFLRRVSVFGIATGAVSLVVALVALFV